ncbi:MAG: hypothetical protein IJV27_11770 [Prevotella sp.]|nr:hypothetical protein [Prevotella sp.]
MRKTIISLLLASMLTYAGKTAAQEKTIQVFAENLKMEIGSDEGSCDFCVHYADDPNDGDATSYYSLQFDIALPQNFSLKTDEEGDVEIERGEVLGTKHNVEIRTVHGTTNHYRVIIYALKAKYSFAKNAGKLFSAKIVGTYDADPTQQFYIYLPGQVLANDDPIGPEPESTQTDNTYARLVLDEMSLEAPQAAASTPGGLTIKRTMKANEWATFCVPFAMTRSEAEAVFGEGVQVVQMNRSKPFYFNEETLTMSIRFDTYANDLRAGGLYLIKPTKVVTEIKFDDGREIKGTAGYVINTYSAMLGTYNYIDNVNTFYSDLAEYVIYLSSDTFYYSKKKVKMKGYRCYWMSKLFDAWLNSESDAKPDITFTIDDDDETTEIISVQAEEDQRADVYTISGQLVGRNIPLTSLPKGLYIVNGRKIFVK